MESNKPAVISFIMCLVQYVGFRQEGPLIMLKIMDYLLKGFFFLVLGPSLMSGEIFWIYTEILEGSPQSDLCLLHTAGYT